MSSKEYSNCAIGEGFAHFYSADVWNSHQQTDRWFESWSTGTPAVDCENSSTRHPNAYLETQCALAHDGYGFEVDWFKQFWDVHTNGTRPTFGAMVAWMNAATEWGTQDGYSRLDSAANTIGGAVNMNWDNIKIVNGFDH